MLVAIYYKRVVTAWYIGPWSRLQDACMSLLTSESLTIKQSSPVNDNVHEMSLR